MRIVQKIALALTIIGAINWGLIGFFSFDLVAAIFGGQDAFLSRVIYSLVGLSGLVCLTLLFTQWEEPDSKEVVSPKRSQNKFNYRTEYGKEEDFSSLKKSKREDK